MSKDKDKKPAIDNLWRASLLGVKPLRVKKRVPEIEIKPIAASAHLRGKDPKPEKNQEKKPEKISAEKKKWVHLERTPTSAAQQKTTQAPPVFAIPTRLEKRKIAKGANPIEATLDLHGLTQKQAHKAVRDFILTARQQGQRQLLIVTGKGKREGEGVLRAKLQDWLATDAQLKLAILSFSPATRAHGGDGAFYIKLRKA